MSSRSSFYQWFTSEETYPKPHDKNGKELDWWEGDVFARSSDRQIEGTIIFDMGCFWLERKRGGRTLLYECVDWSMYKIGNIHTTPELMEQDKDV